MEVDGENDEISRRIFISWSYDAPITRTPLWRGSLRKNQDFKGHVGFRFVGGREKRVINSVSYHGDARRWIASTLLGGEDGAGNSDADYYLDTHTHMKTRLLDRVQIIL